MGDNDMKKVGILTEHRARNFGSCLQAYALQTAIERIGYEANIVDYRPKAIEDSFGIFIVDLYRQCEKNPKKIIKFWINFIVFMPFRMTREIKFWKFRNKRFKLSQKKFVKTTAEAVEKNSYDAYVCGSDQIWNAKITHGLDEVYFAKPFAKSSRKLSYAASIGLGDIEKEKNLFRENLKALDVITVREKTAQELLQPLTDKKIETVLDPTLLLEKNDWKNLFSGRKAPDKKYILVYSLKVDDTMVAYAKKLSEEKNLPVLFFDLRKRYGKNSISKFTAEPTEFLYYLYYADYVVTNSFHGTVFSTIFEKQFVCVPMEGTSSRMVDLLQLIKLDNRLLSEGFDIDKQIDYRDAKEIISEERKRSMKILEDALS